MAGGHETQSPDGSWTLSVLDGLTSSGEEGFRLSVYKGDGSKNYVYDNKAVLTFEAPLPTFDARRSSTRAQWIHDGEVCKFTLATDFGEAFLEVTPRENRILYNANTPTAFATLPNLVDCLSLFFILTVLAVLLKKKSAISR